MKNKYLGVKGFTLVELLVVIAIIGILSSVVLVALNSSREKARNVKVLSDIREMRTIFEANFTNSTYSDLQSKGDGSQIATINSSAPALADIITLLGDASAQNGNGNISNLGGSDNNDLFTDGSAIYVGPGTGNSSGIVIFTTNTSDPLSDYAIYATTTEGYTCIDSSGNVVNPGQGTIAGSAITDVPLDGSSKVVCK